MTKLTRYTSFETLKTNVESNDATAQAHKEQLSALEEFLNLLRSELLNKKKTGNSKTAYGEPFNQ